MDYKENTRELDDMERQLESDKPWDEYSRRLLWELSDCLDSDEQVKNKGELLYTSKADKKGMFIEIYEQAMVGLFEFASERKLKRLEVGTAYYKIAQEKEGSVYITLYNDDVCRLRYMKNGKIIAYLLNKQKGMVKNGN